MRTRALFAAAVAFALSFPSSDAAAEREGYTYLSYVGGSDVVLVSAGEEDSSARANMPVLVGDRLGTGPSSRAEAILADGSIVRFDARTEVRFDRLARTYEADDDRTLLYLQRGAIAVEARHAPAGGLRVDTDDVTVLLSDAGAFRLDAGRRGTEVYVLAGRVELNARSGRAEVVAGEVAYVNATDEIEVEEGRMPRDRFASFVDDRSERRGDGGTRYVSADYAYDYDQAELEDYGSWDYVPAYGRTAWRPRVASGWSPYSDGYWRWTPVGLTWVSYEPWGWLPYHYGSWSFDAGAGWCWLPGSVYSPAWVYWSYTPSYVGWCPVGYYGYHDPYYRALRTWRGYDSAFSYPHLRGRVDVTQVDPRGWRYVSVNRVAGRLERGEILRGDRVRFARGEVGVVSTAHLRVDRPSGGSVVNAVREAARRVPVTSEAAARGGTGRGVDVGLTAVLRREANPTAAVTEELRRSVARAGEDPLYRPSSAEAIGRRDATPAAARGVETARGGDTERGGPGGVRSAPARGGDEAGARGTWRDAPRTVESPRTFDVPSRREGSTVPRSGEATRRDSGERFGAGGAPRTVAEDGWRSRASAPPRSSEVRPSERERDARGDGGWRAPERDGIGSPRRSGDERGSAPAPRIEPRDIAPSQPRSYDAPRRSEAPARREAPPSRAPEVSRPAAPPPPPAAAPRQAPPAPPRSEAPRRERSVSYDGGGESWRSRSDRDSMASRSYGEAPPRRDAGSSWRDSAPRSSYRSEASGRNATRSYAGSSPRDGAPSYGSGTRRPEVRSYGADRYGRGEARAYPPARERPAVPEYSRRSYSSPGESPRSRSYAGESYRSRSYSPPSAPRSYSAPSYQPRSYSAPSAPRSYSAPSAPRSYSAPSAPRSYSAPSYQPRSAPSAPRTESRGAPSQRSAPRASEAPRRRS